MSPHDSTPYDDFADLDRWGKAATPQHMFALGLDTLADGTHDFEVQGAALDRIEEHRVLRVNLRLLREGRAIEHVYWLNRQESTNAFLAEMAALGFPSMKWGDGPHKVPLSQAIPQCAGQLRGLRFTARKTSRHVEAQAPSMGRAGREARTYHDLRIQSRITATSQPAPTVQTPVSKPVQQGQPVPASTPESDIPF